MGERGLDGRWLPGSSGNEGNKGSYKTDMLAVIREAVTVDDWIAITNKAVTDAKTGNNDARNWLSSYTLGKPEENASIALYPVSVDEWWARVEERNADTTD